MNIPSIACSIEGNSQCGGSGPSCHHCDVQAAICPGKKQLSPAMAHPSAAGAAVLVNGPVDSVGSPMLLQAPGSLFYPIFDELPSIAHPMEIFSTRQESLTSYKDRSQLGTCSFSIFGTTSSSPVSSSSSHNTSPGYTRLALSRSYRRVRRKETTRADAPDSQNPGEKQYPLYCSICRVTLNAQIQARQHYNGKQHGRRLRMISRGRSEGGQKEVKATSNLELLGESMTTDWTGNQVRKHVKYFSFLLNLRDILLN